jgi:hypothetical protein
MRKLGKRLIKAAKQAHAIARGKANPATYRVHAFDKIAEGLKEAIAIARR